VRGDRFVGLAAAWDSKSAADNKDARLAGGLGSGMGRRRVKLNDSVSENKKAAQVGVRLLSERVVDQTRSFSA
jgi:hypothetical protein